MKKYDGIWLYTPGNHDWDAGEGEFNSEQYLSDFFQKPWKEKAGDALHLTPGKVWCYYDVPGKDTRVILLNTCGTGTREGKYYYFDDPQLEWLKELLDSTPKDMNVIVMSHYMPHPMGRWTTSPGADYTIVQNEKLMGILSDFKHSGGTMVAMICGDTHTNDYVLYNDVNYYISQGYGWVVPDLMLPGARHAFFINERIRGLFVHFRQTDSLNSFVSIILYIIISGKLSTALTFASSSARTYFSTYRRPLCPNRDATTFTFAPFVSICVAKL